MPEIGTMSENGKRSVAKWLKLAPVLPRRVSNLSLIEMTGP